MDFNKVYQLINQKLALWLHELIRLIPNILLAALVLVLGLFLAKWFKSLITRFLGRITHNATINNLIISIINITFIGIIVFTVLSILQLDKAVTSILAGAGLLGLALAFAFQDIAANFISGIFISFRKPFRVGEIVQLKEYMGKVEEINLRDTVLRLFQGQKVIIPNKDVFQNPIENFSVLGKRRMDITIGVSYGEDLERVRDITLRAVEHLSIYQKQTNPLCTIVNSQTVQLISYFGYGLTLLNNLNIFPWGVRPLSASKKPMMKITS